MRPKSILSGSAFSILALALAAILAVDISAIHTPTTAAIGLSAWVILQLVIIIIALLDTLLLLGFRGAAPAHSTLAAITFILIALLWSISDLRVLSQEGAVELRCVHDILNSDPMYGFWGTCLFGYPARQSYLHSLPTLLLGPSLAAMNFGALLYPILGIAIFAGSLRRYSKYSRTSDIALAFALLLIFHFYYFNETSYRPNMAIFPVGISFIALGFYYRFLGARTQFNLLLLVASLILALHSYTPDLAVFIAGVGILTALMLTASRSAAIPWAQYLSYIILLSTALARSLEYRYDVRLFSSSSQAGGDGTLAALIESLKFIALSTDFVTSAAKVVVLITLAYAILAIRSMQAYCLILFVAGVIVAAAITKGFNFLGVDLRMHRSIVCIPAIVALVYLSLIDIFESTAAWRYQACIRSLVVALTALSAWIGIDYRLAYFATKTPHQHLILIRNLSELSPSIKTLSPLQVHLDPDVSQVLSSLADTLLYFFPFSDTDTLSQSCELQTFAKPNSLGILILAEHSKCRTTAIFDQFCGTCAIRSDISVNTDKYLACVLD